MAGWLLAGNLVALAQDDLDTDYYLVYGSSSAELALELTRKGPNGFVAHTQWNIKSRYHYTELAGGCMLDYSNVDLDIRYTMPKWADRSQSPIALQEEWDNWYARLQAHESKHAAYARKAYAEIQQGFLLLSYGEDCRSLQDQLDSMTKTILANYTEQGRLYDLRTEHGKTEGLDSSFADHSNTD